WEALRSAGPSRARRPSADADPRRDDRGGALSERHGASRSGSRARSLSRPAHEKEPDRERDRREPQEPKRAFGSGDQRSAVKRFGRAVAEGDRAGDVPRLAANAPDRRREPTLGQAEERRRQRDPRAKRTALELVERMRRDADAQKESKECACDDPSIGRRRQRRTEQDIREMPQRVRRMQERPVIAP